MEGNEQCLGDVENWVGFCDVHTKKTKSCIIRKKWNIAMMMRGESTHLWSKLIWVDCDSNIENITVTLYTVVEKLKVKINFN